MKPLLVSGCARACVCPTFVLPTGWEDNVTAVRLQKHPTQPKQNAGRLSRSWVFAGFPVRGNISLSHYSSWIAGARMKMSLWCFVRCQAGAIWAALSLSSLYLIRPLLLRTLICLNLASQNKFESSQRTEAVLRPSTPWVLGTRNLN